VIRKKQTLRLFAKDITSDIAKNRQEVIIHWRAGQLVTDEQKERLLWVAKNCPVARLLEGEIAIDTHLSDDATVPEGTGNYPPSDAESARVTENYSSQP
jgi:hypothetical protein